MTDFRLKICCFSLFKRMNTNTIIIIKNNTKTKNPIPPKQFQNRDPNKHIQDHSISWLGTGTCIKSGGLC